MKAIVGAPTPELLKLIADDAAARNGSDKAARRERCHVLWRSESYGVGQLQVIIAGVVLALVAILSYRFATSSQRYESKGSR